MSSTPDNESEQRWPKTPHIAKSKLIELILSVNPDKKWKQIWNQIRYYQIDSTKHRLPRGDSFSNEDAEEWILAVHPELVFLSGFPKQPKTGFLDSRYFTIDVPPPDELALAYRQCRHENMVLIERNLALEKENDRLEQKLSNWGRPKPT